MMDANLNAIIEKKINKTIGNLQNNKMDAYFVKTSKDALQLVDELCAEGETIYRQAFSCDTYITGTNAITEAGELYNVDGNGNRVAAMIFGPKSVIVVVGYNKIVRDLDAARDRVREVAAPANALRLDYKVPCKVLGACRDCRSDDRLCCSYSIIGQQRKKGRIKVIIVGEQLGY